MLKLHSALLPLPSTASHCIVVCPIIKLISDSGSHKTLGVFPELSVAFGVCHKTVAVDFPLSVSTDLSPTQFITGGLISITNNIYLILVSAANLLTRMSATNIFLKKKHLKAELRDLGENLIKEILCKVINHFYILYRSDKDVPIRLQT